MILPLILLVALSNVATSSPSVCPDIPRAAKHYDLYVQNTLVQLPGGLQYQGLTFNFSYIGPTLTAMLGETISIDVHNNASAGQYRGRVAPFIRGAPLDHMRMHDR